jgi:rod shape-determining protein MreC
MSYQVSDPITGKTVFAGVLFRLLSPFQRILSSAGHNVIESFQTYFVLTNANQENIRLKREVMDLRVKLGIVQSEKEENARLRKILQLHERVPYDLVIAEIAARDAKAFASGTLVINRGLRQGVKQEMPVVTANGVVGIIALSAPTTAKVQVLSDASAAIGAMLEKNRVAGLLVGEGDGRCVLRFLPTNTVFHKGDVVITSGQEGIFPEGLPIGRVNKELSESTLYKAAEVLPFEDAASIREIVVLTRSLSTAPESK